MFSSCVELLKLINRVLFSLTFITHKIFFRSTGYVVPPAAVGYLSAPFRARHVVGFTFTPHGEVCGAAAIRPHPPRSASSAEPDPAAGRVTAQRVDQLLLVVHVVHGGQVGELHSAEGPGLLPGQGAVDEVVLRRCYMRTKNL